MVTVRSRAHGSQGTHRQATLLSAWRAFRAWLPEGEELPAPEWIRRHKAILVLIWGHVVVLVAFGFYMRVSTVLVLGEVSTVAGLGVISSWGMLARRFRASAASLALLTSSAIVVQFSGGYIEAHFHFFVMLAIVAIYQDWVPFLLAIGYVALDHGMVGTLFPAWVYNHPDAIAHPWKWAFIHAGFILGESAALAVWWKMAEEARSRASLTLRSAGDAMLGLDTGGRITFANPAAARLLETTEDALWGHALVDVVEARDDRGARLALDRAPSVEAVRHGEGSLALGASHRTIPIEWVNAPIMKAGTVTGSVLTLKDITERARAKQSVLDSLRGKEALLKEIHHRVKNNLQVISSLLSLQSEYVLDKDARPLFEESRNRVKSMALVHEKLYQSPDISRIDFGEYVRDLATYLFQSYGATGRVKLKVEIQGIALRLDPAISCGLIINELVSNSLKHAFPERREGTITIRLARENATDPACLFVEDDGIGFPADLDFTRTPSMGLKLVVRLVRQIDAKITLDREKGTKFRIQMPESALIEEASPSPRS